jgi:hypothetical protein
VAAAGGKWPPPWQLPLSLYIRSLHASYIRDFAGFDRPWRLLERRLDGFHVTEVALGSGRRNRLRARRTLTRPGRVRLPARCRR